MLFFLLSTKPCRSLQAHFWDNFYTSFEIVIQKKIVIQLCFGMTSLLLGTHKHMTSQSLGIGRRYCVFCFRIKSIHTNSCINFFLLPNQ